LNYQHRQFSRPVRDARKAVSLAFFLRFKRNKAKVARPLVEGKKNLRFVIIFIL